MFAKQISKIFIATLFAVLFLIPSTTQGQVPGGALNAALITRCTCGPGYLVSMTGVPGTPAGLYYIGPQTQFWTGSGYPTAWNLMFYTPSAGQCSMNSGPSCFVITANLVNWYGGSN